MQDNYEKKEYNLMCERAFTNETLSKLRSTESYVFIEKPIGGITIELITNLIPRLGCDFKLLQDFYYKCMLWREDDKTLQYVKGNSMRQLWLRFYMWREHYKVWENEEWRNECDAQV